ncbi:uncharacterized protein LOC114270811 [Camellia sinensis]|uniref:uncharacterized protein LOC114270811 n=1 Tax=Camellia sinensis TaxID=4442 RepID=UPI001036A16F|nr:uncharacterized protein LOC114270811 [Camellia sinensis]
MQCWNLNLINYSEIVHLSGLVHLSGAVWQKSTLNVVIETDAAQAIDLLHSGPSHNSPFRALIEDTKFLLKRCNCSLRHTLREGNRVADRLANLGVVQTDHVVMLEDPPEAVRALIIEDMTGVGAMRA